MRTTLVGVLFLATFAAALRHSSRPQLLLLALKPAVGRDELLTRPALDPNAATVLVTAIAAALSGGSASLLVFAALKSHAPVPLRSLAASALVALGSAAVEMVGHRRHRQFNGRVLSEVGQAFAIGGVGWACFSAVWAAGFGSVLTPGLKPPLNAAAVFGCTAAALGYAQLRTPSPAHVVVPFVCVIVMAHLHVLLHEGPTFPGIEYVLQLTSGAIAAVALGLHGRVLRARTAASPSLRGKVARPTWGFEGTAAVAVLSSTTHLLWTFATLFSWCFSSASKRPYWGLATAAAALYTNELLLHVLMRAGPSPSHHQPGSFFDGLSTFHQGLGRSFACLAAFDTLKGLERTSTIWAASVLNAIWAASSAALGRQWSAALGSGMVLVAIARVLIGSLFGEPLVLAGALGLACGLVLLGLVLRFGAEEQD